MKFTPEGQRIPPEQPISLPQPPKPMGLRTKMWIGAMLLLVIGCGAWADREWLRPYQYMPKMEGNIYSASIRWRSVYFQIKTPIVEDNAIEDITFTLDGVEVLRVTPEGQVIDKNEPGLVLLDRNSFVGGGYPGGREQFLEDVQRYNWRSMLDSIHEQIAAGDVPQAP